MQLGVSAHMKFVNDCLLPGRLGRTIVAPSEGRIDNPATWHKCRAVSLIECKIVAGFELVTKKSGIPTQFSADDFRVRVEEQFIVIEPKTLIGLVWPMD